MPVSTACSHHLEWPAPGARVRGPVLWLRGWLVGRSGHDFCDVRALCGGHAHLGVLGLPRTDLSAHFASARNWLPAEFVIGVPVPDGFAELQLEGQDACGAWHALQTLTFTVAPDGEASARAVGRVEPRPGGTWTLRGTHLPFHGHLDEPKTEVTLEYGRTEIFGWLAHESQTIRTVWATTDLRVFRQLEHGVTDEALAAKVPALRAARHARLRGAADLPPTAAQPVCLRIYAELADGSVHLCVAQRFSAVPSAVTFPPASRPRPAVVPAVPGALPSGRPRRLLVCTQNLERDDSTLRALDIARHLTAGAQWGVRLVTTADGPLRAAFESAGIAIQIVNPQPLFSATTAAAAETTLAALGRQMWLQHLDAIAVFDPECLWLARLGRERQLPVLADYSVESSARRPNDFLNFGGAASALVFASQFAEHSHRADSPDVPATVIPHWHSAGPAASVSATPGARPMIVFPIRGTAAQGAAIVLHAADWLAHHHPEFVGQHRLAITGLRQTAEEDRFVQDAIWNQPALIAIEPSEIATAAACVSPAFSRPPVRHLLDAAAAGVPLIVTDSPVMREIFAAHEVIAFVAGNPLALAHALADLAANPGAAQRRADAAQRRVLAAYAPLVQLDRWQAALESMVAAKR